MSENPMKSNIKLNNELEYHFNFHLGKIFSESRAETGDDNQRGKAGIKSLLTCIIIF